MEGSDPSLNRRTAPAARFICSKQAAVGTGAVSSNIGGVSKAAAETGGAAQHVLTASQALSQQSTVLRGEVETYLRDVKSV